MSGDYWSLTFEADGTVQDLRTAAGAVTDAAAFIADLRGSGATDLFVMSHGWGNSEQDAEHLYDHMFPLIKADPACPAGARFLGVFWPSLWFPDPPPAAQAEVATAVAAGQPGKADAAVTGQAIADSLSPSMDGATGDLKQMGELIDKGLAGAQNGTMTQQEQSAALDDFHSRFQQVFGGAQVATEDSGEGALMTSPDAKKNYQKLSETMGSVPDGGDAQDLGGIFGKVWNGAKDALRIGSYFQMKARAGDVGQKGLGPFLEQLHAAPIRVHLIGHSFGARLVSFALAGISSGDKSPVASLTLVQGAFSHWAFTQAGDNPFGSAGALCDYIDRVNGPLAATFTSADWAVGNWYPKASFLSHQDVEGDEPAGQWDGMGKDGFQAVQPSAELTLPLAGPPPTLNRGSFYRADANAVINNTSLSAFAGAHSDIIKPEVAGLIAAMASAHG